MVKLVVATGLSRTLVMKTGEGFMATAAEENYEPTEGAVVGIFKI